MVAAQKPSGQALDPRLETLFGEHVEAVYNVAFRVLWDHADAEDVVQTTFVRAGGRLDQLADWTKRRPWLLQIAYRQAIALARDRRDDPQDPSEFHARVCPRPCPEDIVLATELVEHVDAAFARLEHKERLAVVLRDVERMSMHDVAETLGISLSAAKMRVHRGRLSLRALLAAKEVR